MNTVNSLALQGFEIFRHEIERQHLKSKTFQPHDYLLHQGQEILELFWVDSGQFTIGYTANNGRNYSLGRNLVDKHLFGEVEYLTSSPCQFNIQASEIVTAKVLPIKVMTAILQLDSKVGIWMSQALSSRYQTGMTMTRIASFTHSSTTSPGTYNNAVSVRDPLLTSPMFTKKLNVLAARSGSTVEWLINYSTWILLKR